VRGGGFKDYWITFKHFELGTVPTAPSRNEEGQTTSAAAAAIATTSDYKLVVVAPERVTRAHRRES